MVIKKGMSKISLFVEIDNTHAIKAYEKFGFKKVDESVFPKKYEKYNLMGFFKMIKELDI